MPNATVSRVRAVIYRTDNPLLQNVDYRASRVCEMPHSSLAPLVDKVVSVVYRSSKLAARAQAAI